MWRNVLGQSIFQIIVLSIFLFAGDYFMDITKKEVGESWTPENGLHFTLIFHTFVFMQVFNEINCRKLGESEFNVFGKFFNNGLFIFIMVVTIIV